MGLNNIKEYDRQIGWMADCQSFDLFSVLLERNVLSADNLDLSFIPLEYLEQIVLCENSEEEGGYLNLLVMLFTEYFQRQVTGEKHFKLSDEKYIQMANQFLFYCKLELHRRDNLLSDLKIEYLFNPNVKTCISFKSKCVDQSIISKAVFLNINLSY